MSKIYLLTGGVLFSMLLLFVQCANKDKSSNSSFIPAAESYKDIHLPLAVVNVDSLLEGYLYAKDLNETLLRKEEGSRATMNQKTRELRSEVEEFQRKLNNNAFLSNERAQQENNRLARKQQDLQELGERMTQDLLVEQQKVIRILNDSVNSSIAVFNADKRYQLILSNASGDNVLYYDASYDITKELTEFMNSRYSGGTGK